MCSQAYCKKLRDIPQFRATSFGFGILENGDEIPVLIECQDEQVFMRLWSELFETKEVKLIPSVLPGFLYRSMLTAREILNVLAIEGVLSVEEDSSMQAMRNENHNESDT
jgi:hypothetical protein